MVKGKYVLRLVALQETCSKEQVENAWKVIQEYADEVLSGYSPAPVQRGATKKYFQRLSYTRRVPQDIYERQPEMFVF